MAILVFCLVVCFIPSQSAYAAGTKIVKTYSELAAAVNDGTTTEIVLGEDITATRSIRPTRDIAFDLNGHTLTLAKKNNLLASGVTIEVKGSGKVIGQENIALVALAKPGAATGLKVGPDVTVEAPYAVGIFPGNKTPTANDVTVEISGTLNGTQMGITTNGNIKDKTNYPRININSGAKISSDILGVYAAGYAEWNIKKGATVTGNTGIYVKAGTVNVDGAQVKGTGTYAAPVPNPGGANPTGSAIVIDSHTGYIGDTVLNISAPTQVTSDDGYAIEETITAGGESKANMTITGGTFMGEKGGVVATEAFIINNLESITGGTFSLLPDKRLLGADYAKNADGTYTVNPEPTPPEPTPADPTPADPKPADPVDQKPGTVKAVSTPKTGDESNLLFLTGMMLLSLMSIAGLSIRMRKN